MGKFISRIITIGVVLCGICFVTCNFYDATNIEDTQTNKINQNNNMLSMMLETDSGSGQYEITSLSSWPTDGYVFNSELSKCENGSKLKWDETNKQVVFSGIITDKCYVYFDIISSVALADYVISQYTGTQGENNIYYHDASLTNGAGDNSYRFAGASESVNNYVCFGTNESTCPTDNLYRIIGVFGDNAKLIKYDYANSNLLGTDGDYSTKIYSKSEYSTYKGELTTINRYSWNYKNNTSINDGSGSNTWSTSLLNKTNLNKNYLNNIGTTWSNLIEDTTWKVSGHTTHDVTPKAMYTAEITNASKTYGPENGTSKIGLMYVSDYGFAAAPSEWTTPLYKYNSSSASVNWMYMGLNEWTITPYSYSSNSNTLFNFSYGGSPGIYYALDAYGTRPVLYLKDSVAYAGGSGTKDSPIRIN